MCTLCQKCHDALSKERIPKFSAANGMWLGDDPAELQDLTIPEEKLISLYRHNSCVIKLQSPFHSATTSQTALKGNCITFLQNIPNIVNSLPLKLDDLCDTLKVIFVGSHPSERIHLRKILTVRKKKIILALQWLKKYNILYQNVEINLENIAKLPEDDVPESIMSTMEQKIGDEEIQSEELDMFPIHYLTQQSTRLQTLFLLIIGKMRHQINDFINILSLVVFLMSMVLMYRRTTSQNIFYTKLKRTE
jgi:hypothetical protein